MKRTVSVYCGHSGCKETAHYEASTKKKASEIYKTYGGGLYRCVRHTDEEKVLGIKNKNRKLVLSAAKSKKYPDLEDLFWDDGSGFVFGPGFKAFANDFPEGTTLIIKAEIVLPQSKLKK